MAYLGGKSKSAEHIIDVLNDPVFNDYDYIEPFCGYCHILRRVINKKSYTASDNNNLLITLLKHNQKVKGEHPEITPEEYDKLRKNPKSNLLRAAYAAFCYSYNGKYFGGFVEKYGTRNYPAERKRYYDLLHDNKTFHDTKFKFTDYLTYHSEKGKLIYCDPPYDSTTEYHSSFNSESFWKEIRSLSRNNYVFVSEYKAPDDFICLAQKTKRTSLSGTGATRKREEKLFVHKSKLTDPKIRELLKTTKYACKNKSLRRTKKNARS